MENKIELKQGDYTELIKELDSNSIDLILTDIPYNISRENNFKTMKDRTGRNGIVFGKWDYDFDVAKLKSLQTLLKFGGSLILFHSFEQYHLFPEIFNTLTFKDKLVWEKTNPMPRNRDRRYISNIELCSWFVKGEDWAFNRQDLYQGCVFRYPSESGGGFKRYHPTQKNLALIQKLVIIHSNERDTILDPLMGSGTTGVACMNTHRNFIGFEIDENYFKIAEQRITSAKNRMEEAERQVPLSTSSPNRIRGLPSRRNSEIMKAIPSNPTRNETV